jgi:hypothetical protein
MKLGKLLWAGLVLFTVLAGLAVFGGLFLFFMGVTTGPVTLLFPS